jgi:2-hydroxychromene-2-carboxylate isomerase
MVRSVEFFFDVGSPYSYLAATRMDALLARTGAQVVWRPFLLGGLFKAVGNTMPAQLAAKARYMLADLMRWAREYDVPFQFSSRFPQNSLRAMRAATFAADRERASPFALALFRAYWVEDRDITADATLTAAATTAGLDGGELLAGCELPAVKDALRAATEEAARRGAFGAPTFFVGEQMFWGNDRLSFVEQALGEGAARE